MSLILHKMTGQLSLPSCLDFLAALSRHLLLSSFYTDNVAFEQGTACNTFTI